MTSKSSSHNAFLFTFKRLFKQCLPLSIIPAAIEVVAIIFKIIDNLINYGNLIDPYRENVVGTVAYDSVFFGMGGLFYGLLIIYSCLFGLIAFRFLTNKRECNVYLSLGITKNKLFWSRYLGAGASLALMNFGVCFLELIFNLLSGKSVLNGPTILLWLYCFAYIFVISMCAFSVTVLSFVNAGNVVEGIVFTVLFGLFPTVFTSLSEKAYGDLVYGSAYKSAAYFLSSDFYNKNWFLDIFGSMTERKIIADVSSVVSIEDFSLPDCRGIFVSLAAFILIAVLACVMFKKRTSEISGTVLKSYNLYRILFVLAAVISFTLATGIRIGNRYLKADLAILIALGVCIIGTLIFTRKIPTKTAITLAASLCVFCVVCFIGYGSSTPERSSIKSVEVGVNPELAVFRNAYNCTFNRGDTTAYYTNDGGDCSYVTLESDSDIEWITDIHKDLIEYGYHSRCEDNGADADIIIKYSLKDGSGVARKYSFESAETYKKILGFMNTDKGRSFTEKLFKNDINNKTQEDVETDDYNEYYSNSKSKFFDIMTESFTLDDMESTVKSYIFAGDPTVFAGFSDKNNLYVGSLEIDLSKDPQLKEALKKDLENQTVDRRYFHSASDEIGMLIVTTDEFSIANAHEAVNYYKKTKPDDQDSWNYAWGESVDSITEPDKYGDNDNSDYVYPVERESYLKHKKEARDLYFSAGFCNDDRLNDVNSTFKTVVTKDMVNTVKWLKDNGLYKQSTGGAKLVKARGVMRDESSHYDYTLKNTTFISAVTNGFGRDNPNMEKLAQNAYFGGSGFVTDQKTLEDMLSNSRLSAANLYDNYIVEFFFDDGTQVTKYISKHNVNKESAEVFGKSSSNRYSY